MSGRTLRSVIATIVLCTSGCSRAVDFDTEADHAVARLSAFFANEPAVRAWIARAKAADAIPDLMQRCLAFPDLPGQQWPEGTIKAHCEFSFGKTVCLDVCRDGIASDDFRGLEAAFARDLRRHFSKRDYSEAIHADFDIIGSSERSDALTRAWLAKYPRSAFALTARGKYFHALAWSARSGRPWSEMDEASRQRQSESAGYAIDFFRKAIAVEPRLMPAYALMASAAILDSRKEAEKEAIAGGLRMDPACVLLASQILFNLQPKWGGREGAMQDFAATLQPHLKERPLLAIPMVFGMLQEAAIAEENKDFAREFRYAALAATKSSDDKPLWQMDFARASTPGVSRLEPVVYALAGSRFNAGWERQQRVSFYLRNWLSDVDWADMVLLRGVAGSPNDGRRRMVLGKVYEDRGDWGRAREQYVLAGRDERARDDAAKGLGRIGRSPAFPPDPSVWIAAPDAVARAAKAADGVEGVFVVDVVAASEESGELFLNSAADPHERHNLTIEIAPDLAKHLRDLLKGKDPVEALTNQRVVVKGVARHVSAPEAGSSARAGTTRIMVTDGENMWVLDKP